MLTSSLTPSMTTTSVTSVIRFNNNRLFTLSMNATDGEAYLITIMENVGSYQHFAYFTDSDMSGNIDGVFVGKSTYLFVSSMSMI